MPTRFAINGAGRIGRALIRILRSRPGLELVAINDLAPIDQIAALVSRDTLHGKFPGTVSANGSHLVLDGHPVATSHEPNLDQVPWLGEEPQVVIDATGRCKSGDLAQLHKRGSVQKVVVSANAAKMDLTLCMGVNHQKYDHDRHHLLSAASCTTNCLAPMVHVLDRVFGIEQGLFNTVHSYNNDQHLLSFPHPDKRRARTATLNMIPTTTSASHAIHRVIPDLEGKLDGFAVRVPTPDVSLVDLVVELKATPNATEINTAFVEASAGDLRGIVAVTQEELVSSDFLGDPHSAIIDLPLTQALDNGPVRVVAWYDNEWGHASRLADVLEFIGPALT
jgi:glyceraldehyde 3-phosphate dehydrogenase